MSNRDQINRDIKDIISSSDSIKWVISESENISDDDKENQIKVINNQMDHVISEMLIHHHEELRDHHKLLMESNQDSLNRIMMDQKGIK